MAKKKTAEKVAAKSESGWQRRSQGEAGQGRGRSDCRCSS